MLKTITKPLKARTCESAKILKCYSKVIENGVESFLEVFFGNFLKFDFSLLCQVLFNRLSTARLSLF